MNERPIQVGDLVMVVRGRNPGTCLCTDRSKSAKAIPIFRVRQISVTKGLCPDCRTTTAASLKAWVDGKHEAYDLYRLKRIPPLSELEGQRSEDARPLSQEDFSRRVDEMQKALRA